MIGLAGFYHGVKYHPFKTWKDNANNVIQEFFFMVIHIVIGVLIWDQRMGYFTELEKINLGWGIIFSCMVIMLWAIGLIGF